MSAGPRTHDDEVAELPRADGQDRDGIGEEDHAIPPWFNWTFIASIVFACVYVPYFTLSGWSSASRFAAEVERSETQLAAFRESMPSTNPYMGVETAIAEGEETWNTVCAACHKPDGTGLVGPSLVDPYWKYGETDEAKFVSVSEGRPLGMPPWGAQLGTEKIWKTLAYLETLPKSSEPGVGAPGS